MNTKKLWNSGELTVLSQSYTNTSTKELSHLLNRTPKSIRNKANNMGLIATTRSWSFPRTVKTFPKSAELSYLIGALKGDGSVFRNGRLYCVTLSAISYDFVNAVNQAMLTVTSRSSLIYKTSQASPFGHTELWCVKRSSKDLYYLMKKPLVDLMPLIVDFPNEFLKGFFDAEGSAWINHRGEPVVKFSNTDFQMMVYVKSLLEKLDIKPSPKMVEEKHVYINGNKLERPKPLYSILIQKKNSAKRFMELVGSSLPHKRLDLHII